MYIYRIQVSGIVIACIQSALSMVKDKAEESSREIDRVRLVLRCLDKKQFGDRGTYN